MPDHFVTLGAFGFKAQEVEVGALPRSIAVSANALSTEPVQVNSYTPDFMLIRIDGMLQGRDTADETATAHLIRLKANLRTEVAKDTNSLTIAWNGASEEIYRVFKNTDFSLVYTWNVRASRIIVFSLTLNCLP